MGQDPEFFFHSCDARKLHAQTVLQDLFQDTAFSLGLGKSRKSCKFRKSRKSRKSCANQDFFLVRDYQCVITMRDFECEITSARFQVLDFDCET